MKEATVVNKSDFMGLVEAGFSAEKLKQRFKIGEPTLKKYLKKFYGTVSLTKAKEKIRNKKNEALAKAKPVKVSALKAAGQSIKAVRAKVRAA